MVLTGGSSKFLGLLKRLAAVPVPSLGEPAATVSPPPRPAQRRLTNHQVAELVAEYQAGADMQELAVRWQVHRTTVAAHLRLSGVELRRQGVPANRVDEAIRLYREGWSCERLAERYDCDDETVRQSLKRAGVTLRRSWERP